jgi:hypothetical protein
MHPLHSPIRLVFDRGTLLLTGLGRDAGAPPSASASATGYIRCHGLRRIPMAVSAASLREGAAIPEDVLVYKSAIKVEPVLEALERLRAQVKSG